MTFVTPCARLTPRIDLVAITSQPNSRLARNTTATSSTERYPTWRTASTALT